jgi:fatty acid desaturase
MTALTQPARIPWRRSPVPRDALPLLNQRSDAKGLIQTLGHLGLLLLTGVLAWLAFYRLASPARIPLFVVTLYVHGALWAFLLNGFHELCHKTVFKSKGLNAFFLIAVSFLSWYNPIFFWASHQEHHKWTLHPPDDLEVVLPVRLTVADFLKVAIVSPWEMGKRVSEFVRFSLGRLEGQWENHLFPPEAARERAALFRYARLHLLGHALIVLVSLALGWWLVPVLVTLAPFYGNGLQWLLNNTQHTGLMDNTPDYRLACRTIHINPFLRFIYWNMNYHTEHHMYAAVPCYNLPALHEHVKGDLPPSRRGVVAAWREIIMILRRQEVEPGWQHRQEIPAV